MDKNSADEFSDAFMRFMEIIDLDPNRTELNYENKMVLDCANGVGTIPMRLVSS
jgi:phosphoacetylglucosamine mutase